MPSVFDLPHVFVVFAPGAGGNFLAGLLTELINGEYSELEISESGSSHTTVSKKFESTSDLSMGTFVDNILNADEKIEYYGELFSKLQITHPMISWTHDFKNIALYRNMFTNSKIIVVTQNTNEEQLAITFMHVIKNILDPNVVTPIPADYHKFMQKLYMQSCIKILSENLSKQQIDEIMSNPAYSDIITFTHLKIFLNFYGLLHLVEDMPKQHIKENNPIGMYSLTNKPYEIDKYVTDDCVLLPYSCIMSGDTLTLLDAITATLSRNLTSAEIKFVTDNYSRYRAKQNLDILTNPVHYYNYLKKKTHDMITTCFGQIDEKRG